MRLVCSAFLVTGLLAAPPVPVPFPEAEAAFLEAWDFSDGSGAVPVPSVAAKDQATLRWLVNAATQTVPANPFRRSDASWREAEAVRRFLALPAQAWEKELDKLPLGLGGSCLALWRWGQPKVRAGEVGAPLRRRWEDRLLESRSPGVVRSLALRHALCFALDAGDADRFVQVREACGEDFQDLLADFQNAFALLGSPAPLLSLWKLPGLEPVDLSVSQLGVRQVRIEADPGNGLPQLPADAIWVVPTLEGSQPRASATLEGSSRAEAERLASRLRTAGRTAYLAPVREALETYALTFFPIRIDLDAGGAVTRIRMGDALLARPRE